MTTKQKVKLLVRSCFLGFGLVGLSALVLFLGAVMINDMIKQFQAAGPEGRQVMGLIIAGGIVIGLLVCLWGWANSPD